MADKDDGFIVLGDMDTLNPVELRAVNIKLNRRDFVRAPTVPPMTKTKCPCKRGYLLREGEASCWRCQSDETQRREFAEATAGRLTAQEALAELTHLAASQDPEHAHVSAEIILLKLIGDPEIAAAFNAVPKWYA